MPGRYCRRAFHAGAGGAELTAAEVDRDFLEVSVGAAPSEIGAVKSEAAEAPLLGGTAEPAATPAVPSARPAEPPAGSVVTSTAPAVTAATPPAAAPAGALAAPTHRVTGDRVNLREGPDADTASLGLLSLGDTVEVLEEDGDLLRVRTEDGEEGWAAARFLAPSPG